MARRKIVNNEKGEKQGAQQQKKRLIKKSSAKKVELEPKAQKKNNGKKALHDRIEYDDSESNNMSHKPVQINQQNEDSNMSEEEFVKFMEEQRKQRKKDQEKQTKEKNKKKEPKKKAKNIFTEDTKKPCTGLRYVLTGLFHCVEDRKQIQKLIENLGGRVTSAVSGVTDVLLYGYKLEDGRDSCESQKYKKAQKLGVQLVDEQQFSDQLKEIYGKTLSESMGVSMVQKSKQKSEYIEQYKKRFEVEQNEDQQLQIEDLLEDEKQNNQLWSDKYAPKKPEQILGNTAQIKNLTQWLKDWKKYEKSGLSNQKKDSKAVLLSGSPGIGKTTAATVISKYLGFDYIVQNASNQRNKASVNAMLSGLKDNQTIGHFLVKKSNNKNKVNKMANQNCVIIMDEVDGMTGDRGGVGELVQQIKTTQQPIICICNDNQANAIRTLKTYCYNLEFKEPSLDEISGLLEVILTNEVSADFWNLIDKSILQIIVQTCQNDIRQIINYLQMWLKGIDLENLQQVRDIKQLSYITSKDMLKLNTPFQAVKKILNTKLTSSTDFHELRRLFFTDYNSMGLFVYENYLPQQIKGIQDLENVEEALESFATGDKIEQQIQQDRDYTLLNQQCYFTTIRPALLISRFVGFPQFPQYLARYQSRKKRDRLLYEMKDCILNVCHQTSNDQDVIIMLEILCEQITEMLNKGSFDELYNMYQGLNINPIMIKENLKILMDFHSKSQTLSKINVKKKTKFNQFYTQKVSVERNNKKAQNKKKKGKNKDKSQKKSLEEEEEIIDKQSDLDGFIVPDEYID